MAAIGYAGGGVLWGESVAARPGFEPGQEDSKSVPARLAGSTSIKSESEATANDGLHVHVYPAVAVNVAVKLAVLRAGSEAPIPATSGSRRGLRRACDGLLGALVMQVLGGQLVYSATDLVGLSSAATSRTSSEPRLQGTSSGRRE